MTDLDEAVALYIGWKTTSFPTEDARRVIDRFGPDASVALLARVRELLEELGRVRPDWTQHDLASASDWAADQVGQRHPALTKATRSALAWIYSWWNK